MNPVISISMAANGLWQAVGHFLGEEISIEASSLWDCLEECKQRVWDIEIAHDVAAGRFHPDRLATELTNGDSTDPLDRGGLEGGESGHEGLHPGAPDRSDHKP